MRVGDVNDWAPTPNNGLNVVCGIGERLPEDEIESVVSEAGGIRIEGAEISGVRVIQSRFRRAIGRVAAIIAQSLRQALVPTPHHADFSRQDRPVGKPGALAFD